MTIPSPIPVLAIVAAIVTGVFAVAGVIAYFRINLGDVQRLDKTEKDKRKDNTPK